MRRHELEIECSNWPQTYFGIWQRFDLLIASLLMVNLLLIAGCGQHITKSKVSTAEQKAPQNKATVEDIITKEVEGGDITAIGKRLDGGMDVSRRLTNNKTLIIIAVEWLKLDLVKFLMEQKADPALTDDFGKSAFDYADNNKQVLQLLEGKDPIADLNQQLFVIIEQKGDAGFSEVGLLIGAGARINARDEKQRTPLILSSELGLPRVVRMLLSKGLNGDGEKIDLHAVDEDNRTALMAAIENRDRHRNYDRVIQILGQALKK